MINSLLTGYGLLRPEHLQVFIEYKNNCLSHKVHAQTPKINKYLNIIHMNMYIVAAPLYIQYVIAAVDAFVPQTAAHAQPPTIMRLILD